MTAIPVAIELLADLSDGREGEPVRQLASDVGTAQPRVQAFFSVNLAERSTDGGDIATMAVQKEEALEPVAGEGKDAIPDDRD